MKNISIVPENIRKYMNSPIDCHEDIGKLCDWHGDNNRGTNITLENGKTVKNLVPGETYDIDGECFRVNLEYPRLLDVDGLENVRDLGNKYIPFGKIFRGPTFAKLSQDTADILKNELNIKTELDVSGSENNDVAERNFNQVKVPCMWYQHIFEKPETYENYAIAMRTFTDENNFPVYFHCTLGRDRTGCIAMFLLALSGHSIQDMAHEQFLSFFSNKGDGENAGTAAHYGNFDIFISLLMKVKGPEYSVKENAEEFMRVIGLSAEEIAKIEKNITK